MQIDLYKKLEVYCQTRNPVLRNELVEDYLYLAQAVARRFAGRGAEMEDLAQVGAIALMHALERFDCNKGVKFTTFAVPTLTGELRNYLRDKARLVRLPRRGAELLPQIVRERGTLLQANGREPSVMELAERLSLPADDVLDALEMQRSTQALSLDSAPDEDGTALNNLLGREEEAFERMESKDLIKSLLSQLEGKSRFVIEERFLRQRSQRDIAKDLGVSQMQISRLERRALAALRDKFA